MTPRQRNILIALTVLVALTRWWAMSRTIWDWDEALFATGVRSFDVVEHHPHPPGFPLFILAGKVINLFVHDEFRSLQLITVAGACLLFPAAFFLAFELGFGFGVSVGGALMTVFAPSVWFYGGTAFSDIPSLTLVMAAAALLLMSRHRGAGFLIAGALLLGISAGFRSQNLVIGFFPFLLAAWPRVRARQWTMVMTAALVIAVVFMASYIGAGLASYSWSEYQITLKQHRQYIVTIDSFRGPIRPPLRQLFDDFFMRIFQFWRGSLAIFLLAIVSVIDAIIRRRRPPLYLLATFGPFAISAYLILDFNSVTRFSIGYLPMFAILGADGIGVMAGWLRMRESLRDAVAALGACLLAIGMVIWAAPGILEARRTISPAAEAIQWIRGNLSPQTATIYVTKAMKALSEYELPDYRLVRVQDERGIPLGASEAENAWLLAEGITMEPTGLNFLRPRESRLWRIARKRYFEISIIPLARRAQFLAGWHEAENEGAEAWRWMGRRSVTILPSQGAPAKLRLRFTVPLDAIPQPNIRILFNGAEIGRLHAVTRRADFEAVLTSTHADSPNELVIETDQWVNPKQKGISDDSRDLGLRLEDMSWGKPDR